MKMVVFHWENIGKPEENCSFHGKKIGKPEEMVVFMRFNGIYPLVN